MKSQDSSPQECRNAEMQNGEINARPCACNLTVLDTWKSDRRATIALQS
jgi:hypothetical protein